MNVQVQYLGPVRILVNKQEEEVELSSGTTIYELLQKLAVIYGQAFDREIFEDDRQSIREGLIITINGIAIGQLNDLQTPLKSEDVVTLLPCFSGGG